MNRCGATVTGTRTRYTCFMMQLKSTSIYILNALRLVFPILDIDCDIRSTIDHALSMDKLDRQKEIFITYLTKKKVDLPVIINTALCAYVELMGMDHVQKNTKTGMYIDNPLHKLWSFFIRQIYERPRLLLPDNNNGDNIEIVKESLEYYLSEQVMIPKK
jgi:hypothetical protein